MDNGSNTTLNVYPSLDAIAEFKVLTSNYGAQYGRNGSGTVEVETKSGTNSFHGDAYEFVRNDVFNATTFSAEQSCRRTRRTISDTPSAVRYSFPGFTTRTAQDFLFLVAGVAQGAGPGQSGSVIVPSLAERGGDFSDLCPGAGFVQIARSIPHRTCRFPAIIVPIDPVQCSRAHGADSRPTQGLEHLERFAHPAHHLA